MKNKTRLIAIGVGMFALARLTHAGAPPASLEMIPPQINYQGRLMAPDNTPYNDRTHVIDLTLYPTAVGGTTNWSERYSVQTRDGYFSVNLGSGGTKLLVPANRNKEIWEVLWKDVTDATAPNTFYMALTVRTDANGQALPTAVESGPRQQFLTAPFAYRAHQSVYASKADGTFTAGTLVATNLSATSLGAGSIVSTSLNASSITTANLSANINAAGSTVGGLRMFVRKSVGLTYSNVDRMSVAHQMDSANYDLMVVGWAGSHPPRTLTVDSTWVTAVFAANGSGSITVEVLGIRKGLTLFQ